MQPAFNKTLPEHQMHHRRFCTRRPDPLMTDALTIPAQQRNRLHSHKLYRESITINRQDELFIWVLKADLACIVYYRSQADTAAEADDIRETFLLQILLKQLPV